MTKKQTQTRGMKLAALQAQMYQEGFTPGYPFWGMIDGSSIDDDACRGSTCPACGHQGMEHYPFIIAEAKIYRSIVACPNCHYAEEF